MSENPLESRSFELPEANKEFTKMIEQLVSGFAGPLDGEIAYTPIGETGYRKAIGFFGASKEIVSLQDIENFQRKVDNRLKQVDKMFDFCKNHFTGALRKFYEDSLEEFKLKFVMFQSAVWLEAEKGGYELKESHRDEYLTVVKGCMSEIRGEPISTSRERIEGAYGDIYTKFLENNHVLSPDESAALIKFFTMLENTYDINVPTHAGIDKAVKDVLQKDAPKSLLDKALDATYQSQLMEGIIDLEQSINQGNGAMGGDDRKAVVRNKGNYAVYHQEKKVYTPGVGKRIAGPVVRAQGHEEVHVRSGKNTNEFFGVGFKGRGYLGTEEARATASELITNGTIQKVEDLGRLKKGSDEKTRAIVVCEHYGYDESVKLIEIFIKLGLHEIGSYKNNPAGRVDRTKRFGPLDIPYASTKDRAYLDGMDDVMAYLKKSTSIEDMVKRLNTLNEFKVSIKDLALIAQIKEELGIKDQYLHKTQFITRRLRRALEGKDDTDIEKGTLDEHIYQKEVDIRDLLTIVQTA